MADKSEEPMTDVADRTDVDEEIDQEILEEARRQVGVSSSNAAINIALRRLVEERRERRRRAYIEIQQMVADGLLDLDAIERIRKC